MTKEQRRLQGIVRNYERTFIQMRREGELPSRDQLNDFHHFWNKWMASYQPHDRLARRAMYRKLDQAIKNRSAA